MTAKHTPGVWFAEPHTGTEMLILAAVDGSQEILARIQTTGRAGEMEANAPLISAAPELLEALRTARFTLSAVGALEFTDGPNGETTREVIDSAIARAEGR